MYVQDLDCVFFEKAHAAGSHGVPQSFKEAFFWAKESIVLGGGEEIMSLEQRNLFVTVAFQAGLMLMQGGFGLGDPNPEGAVVFWQSSASVGHAHSIWNLGVFCLNGYSCVDNTLLLKKKTSLCRLWLACRYSRGC